MAWRGNDDHHQGLPRMQIVLQGVTPRAAHDLHAQPGSPKAGGVSRRAALRMASSNRLRYALDLLDTLRR